MKDKNKAHDVIHTFYGGKAENCPRCVGSLDDKQMLAEAEKIACENYKPRVNPTISFDQRLMQYADDSGNVPTVPSESVALREQAPDVVTMVDIMQFSEDKTKLPEWIKLIPIGKYKMNGYGEVNITREIIQEMKKHFDEGVRAGGKAAGLPVDVEHGTTQYGNAAGAWIKEIEVRKDGGWGRMEYTKLGEQLLTDKIYKFYSPEFWFNYVDPENNDIKLKNVMTGGGFVNKPMIKHDLKPLVNAENTDQNKHLTRNENTPTIFLELTNSLQNESSEKHMKLSEILTKAKETRTSDEQKFVIDHKDELTFAEAKKEGLAQDAITTTKETENKISLSEGQMVVDKTKFDSLVSLAERGANADEKLRKAELRDKVKAATFSEKGIKIPAADVDKWTEKLFKMSETDQTDTLEMLKGLPEKQIFTENGTVHEGAGTAAGVDLDKKAKELAASEKITYAEALSRVAAENPTQLSEYNQNLPIATVER